MYRYNQKRLIVRLFHLYIYFQQFSLKKNEVQYLGPKLNHENL